MNERARNLKEILKNIIANEEESKEFEKLKTIPEIYEKCIAKGYKGGMEEFTSDLMTLELLPKEMIEMIEEKLNEVSGGKLDAKKGIASILSGLTVMSAGGININAAQVAPKEASKKTSLNSIKNPFINKSFLNKADRKAAGIVAGVGTGLLTVGTLGVYMLKGLSGEKNDVTPTPTTITNSNEQEDKFWKLIVKIAALQRNFKDVNFKASMALLKNILMSVHKDYDGKILNELFYKSKDDGELVCEMVRHGPIIYDSCYHSCHYSAQDVQKANDYYGQHGLFRLFILGDLQNSSSNVPVIPGTMYSTNIIEQLSDFSHNLSKSIKNLFPQDFSNENFSNGFNIEINFVFEIYEIQRNIKEAISKIENLSESTGLEAEDFKKKKEEAIKNLKDVDNILSGFVDFLYYKVNVVNIREE